mgnify:CR=1 FL=1
MGCGCGKGRNNRRQSSRMPASTQPKKIKNIKIPAMMTPNQRRSAMVKIQNQSKAQQRKRVADIINDRVKKSGGS